MKIVIDCRKLRDLGIGTYVENIVAHLHTIDRDNEYALLCFEADAEDLRRFFPVRVVSAGLYTAAELHSISRAVETERADLFHSPHYVLPFFLPCRSVVTVHDIIHLLYPEAVPGTHARLYARYFIRRALKVAAATITVSDNSRADIIARYPWASSRVHRVYNGVDPYFSTNVEKERTDRPFFLCVGNNKPHKNLPLLLEAYRRYSAASPEIDLVVVGFDGEVGMPPPPGARLLGYVEKARLARLYRSAIALLCPSRYEGFGLPAVEAQSSGCPVVASDIPVFREILGDSAFLFDGDDPSALADAMERVAKVESVGRSELIARGSANSRRFCFAACARETLEIYRRVGGASGEGRAGG